MLNRILVILLILFLLLPGILQAEETYNIAFAGPLTGKNSAKGKAMLEGITMYIDQLNEQGGIRGKKVKLLLFDDQNEKGVAREIAIKIARESDALAVLGHRNSSVSIAAGAIYREFKIPAVTGTATADEVTQGNDWYFRIIFDNAQQGKMIAYYAKKVLNYNRISIIYDEDAYGQSLMKAFESTALKVGIKITNKWSFNTQAKDFEFQIKRIVRESRDSQGTEAIFLATHDVETVSIIKNMKEQALDLPLLGGASLGKQSFSKRFSSLALEKMSPGYYTDGLLASTYFRYDVAGRRAKQFRQDFFDKYQKDPGAQSISSYDVAGIVINAIKQTHITGKDTAEDRRKIRDFLAGHNSIATSYKGVTGAIYFDNQGTAVKSVPMAVFRKQKLISAPVQISQVTNLKEVQLFRGKSNAQVKDIFELDGMALRKTNVVYTGIKINEISNFDEKELTYDLNFYLWFRFHGELELNKIEFLNAQEPIFLQEPINEQHTGQLNYRLYHVKGRFKGTFQPGLFAQHQHMLNMSFRHPRAPLDKLIFVGDVLNGRISDSPSLLKKMKQEQVLNPSSGWSIDNILFYQDIMRENSLGEIDYVNINKSIIEYSRYNVGIKIKKDQFTLRGLIPPEYAMYLLLISLLLFPVSSMLCRRATRMGSLVFTWILQGSSILSLLIACEVVLLDFLSLRIDFYIFNLITMVFDILWWLILAFLLNLAAKYFIWFPLEHQTKQKVPILVKRFVVFLLYLLAFMGIIAFVYNLKITSLLATSGVIAMIIGLAIQINISNIFSGIAINIERPFRIGDWVEIGSHMGIVEDISWRSTRIRKGDGSIEYIPNATASESVIRNYCPEAKPAQIIHSIHINAKHAPEMVIKILKEALFQSQKILQDPQPNVALKEFTDWSAQYVLLFHLTDYGQRFSARDEVLAQVWEHLNQYGIHPAVRFREAQPEQKQNRPTKVG